MPDDQLSLATWQFQFPRSDIIHAIYRRESPNYNGLMRLDYVTACNKTISVDGVTKRSRLYARTVTCLMCAVAAVNADVISDE